MPSRVPSRVPSRRPSVAAVPEGGSHLRTEERVGSGDSEVSRERSEDSNTSSGGASAGEGTGSDTASSMCFPHPWVSRRFFSSNILSVK